MRDTTNKGYVIMRDGSKVPLDDAIEKTDGNTITLKEEYVNFLSIHYSVPEEKKITCENKGWRGEIGKLSYKGTYSGTRDDGNSTSGRFGAPYLLPDDMLSVIEKVEREAYERAAEVANEHILTISERDHNKSGIRNYNMACKDIASFITSLINNDK